MPNKFIRSFVLSMVLAILVSACSEPVPSTPADAIPTHSGDASPSAPPLPPTTTQISPTAQSQKPTNIPRSSTTPSPAPSPLPTYPYARENTQVPKSLEPINFLNVSKVVELARLGKGNANDAAYSPDSGILAVASSIGIYLYDRNQKLVEMIDTTLPVYSVAFEPCSGMLAAAMADGKIELWRWQTKTLVRTIVLPTAGVITALQFPFSTDAGKLAFILFDPQTRDNTLNIIDFATEELIIKEDFNYVDGYALSGDFSMLIRTWGWGYEQFAILDLSQSQSDWELVDMPDQDYAFSVTFSDDGHQFAIAGVDTVYLWNLGEHSPFLSIPIKTSMPYVNWSSAACGQNADGGGVVSTQTIAFSADARMLIAAATDGAVHFFSTVDGSRVIPTQLSTGPNHVVSKISQTYDRTTMVFLYRDGTIEERSGEHGSQIGVIGGHVSSYTSLALTPGSQSVGVGSADGRVRFWNLSTGQRVLDLENQANSIAISKDGSLIALGSEDGSIHLWDLLQGTPLGQRWDHDFPVKEVEISPNGETIVSLGYDCALRFWQAAEGLPREGGLIPELPYGPAYPFLMDAKIEFAADGRWLFVGGWGLWQVDIKEPNDLLQLNNDQTSEHYLGLAVSHIDPILAAAKGGKVELWNYELQRKLYTWNYAARSLTFSPDGRMLAIGDGNGIIFLIDPETGELLDEIGKHQAAVTDLAFTASGEVLISSSEDGTVRLWGIPE